MDGHHESARHLVEGVTNHALVAIYNAQRCHQNVSVPFPLSSRWRSSSLVVDGSESDDDDENEVVDNGADLQNGDADGQNGDLGDYRYFGRHKSFSLPHRWRSRVSPVDKPNDNDRLVIGDPDDGETALVAPSYGQWGRQSMCVCRHLGVNRHKIVAPTLLGSGQGQSSLLHKNVNPNEFLKRRNIMVKWFGEFNDEQKNLILKQFLVKCGTPQNHYLSLAMEPNMHKLCPPNCCDFLSWLPSTLSLYILKFLDPVSLCRCAQVCRSWNPLANHSLLWQRFCTAKQWQLSPIGERKQMSICSQADGSILWKKAFSERFRLLRNWMRGYCHVRTFEGHTQGISCIQFDDTRIVSGSSDKTIKVWNIRTNSQWSVMTLVGHSGTVRCLHLEGNRLVSGSTDCTIKVWDLSSHSGWSSIACKVTMIGHNDTVRCLQVDDEKVVSGSYDRTLKVWDLRSGDCKLSLSGHEGAVLCVQHDRTKIISGSADKTIKIWNFVPGYCINTLYGHQDAVTCLQFDSHRIVSGSLDRTIKFWNLANGQCVSTLDWMKSEGHTGVIRCLQADRWRIVSAGDDKTLKVWSLETGQRLVTLKNHTDGVTCLQFNDHVIVSGSYDKTVKLWDFSVC